MYFILVFDFDDGHIVYPLFSARFFEASRRDVASQLITLA